MKKQLYLQSFGHVDLELNGKERQQWRARALTKIIKSNSEIDESREESLQIVIQDRNKFAYIDLDAVQLSKAVEISAISKRCNAFSLTRDGWSLFGINEKQMPRFVALTKNFQAVKNIKPHVDMSIKKHIKTNTYHHRCVLYRLHKRFVQLYRRLIARSKHVRYKENATFPHISSSANGLAMLCATEPGCCYIWEYHRNIGKRWKDIDDCNSVTVPGVWKKVFQNKIQFQDWFLHQKAVRIESRIFFDDQMEIAGALAFISMSFTHIHIMWTPIAKEGENFFFKFSSLAIDIRNLRSKSEGTFSYIARLNATGDRIVIGINIPYNSYICSFPISEEELVVHSAPHLPLPLCHHCHIGLSVYDMSNPKYCCIVDIQWIANDKTFAVMTNCGSLAIFDSKVDSVVTSILSDAFYIEPSIYHQIFQKSHHPNPDKDAYQTIRPPNLQYWSDLTFSMFWSAKQNMLICSSGKSITLFSIVHAENLSDHHISQSDTPIVQESHQKSKAQLDATDARDTYAELEDIICPSFDITSVNDMYSKSVEHEKSSLLKSVQMLASNLPEPHITIRPVKVDVTQPRSFQMLPIHFDFQDNILLPMSSYTISETRIPLSTIEDIMTDFDPNEYNDKRSQSLPDLHVLGDFENFADDEHTTSELENNNEREKKCDTNGNKSHVIRQEHEIASLTDKSYNEMGLIDLPDTIASSQMSLEIPNAPEIHSLVQLTNYTGHEVVEIESKEISTQTSMPQTPKESSDETENKLFRTEPIVTPSLTCMKEEYRNRDLVKPLVMVKLQPFTRLSEVLTGEASPSATISSENFKETLAADKIAIEIAQRKIEAAMKARELEQKLFQQMKERLRDLRIQSEMFRVNAVINMASKTLLQPNRKVRSATSNTVQKKSSKKRKYVRSNHSLDSVSINTKSVSLDRKNQSSNNTSISKKQISGNNQKTDWVLLNDYSHVSPRVNSFNYSYNARQNSNPKSKTNVSSISNSKVPTTVKSDDNCRKSENVNSPKKYESSKHPQAKNTSTSKKGDDSSLNFKKSSPKNEDDSSLNFKKSSPKNGDNSSLNFKKSSPKNGDDSSLNFKKSNPKNGDNSSLNFKKSSPEKGDVSSLNSKKFSRVGSPGRDVKFGNPQKVVNKQNSSTNKVPTNSTAKKVARNSPRKVITTNTPRKPDNSKTGKESPNINTPPKLDNLNKNRPRSSTPIEGSKKISKNAETKSSITSNEKQWTIQPNRIPTRGNFTNDGEKLLEQAKEFDRNEMHSPEKYKELPNENNDFGPPNVIQATNKWVQSKTTHPDGFDMVAKSGVRIRSVSSISAETLSSTEFPDLPDFESSDNEGKIADIKKSRIIPLIDEEESRHRLQRIIEFVINNTLDKTGEAVINENIKYEENFNNDQITKLEIEEEEGENIPLRSILNQSPKKCGRKVSFCEPIALYRTLSSNELDQNEVETINNPAPH